MMGEFKILANTFCIGKKNSDNYKVLIDGNNKFRIPIFQRPYSWNESIVTKFIKDILNSFMTSDGDVVQEPMFIGTMQLKKPKNNTYDVIDGQQRLTTLLLFFKVLNDVSTQKLSLDWLSTVVNNGEQQQSLSEALQTQIKEVLEDSNNRYSQNLLIIRDLLDDKFGLDEETDIYLIQQFIDYVLSSVYFVVIETHAGLSKTLQIFDTINTTGLDLNGGDIFKIRMYEYLTTKKQQKESVFEDISALYQKIESKNKEYNINISVSQILNLYQHSLIAKYNLPTTLHKLNSTTFFERLFDSIFSIETWKNFTKANKVELNLADLDKIIDSRFEWYSLPPFSVSVSASHRLMSMSRYGRYWVLWVLFYHKFKDIDPSNKELNKFTVLLSKLYVMYSILYKRSINEIHSLSYKLFSSIESKNLTETINIIQNKIIANKDNQHLKRLVSYNLTSVRKRKDLICRIAALHYENKSTVTKEIDDIINKLFESSIDIEHIQSYNDSDLKKREHIKDEWGEELNGLGNLVVLESSINKSISNNSFLVKKESYKKSKFKIVSETLSNLEDWTKQNTTKRREVLEEIVNDYFFDSL